MENDLISDPVYLRDESLVHYKPTATIRETKKKQYPRKMLRQ